MNSWTWRDGVVKVMAGLLSHSHRVMLACNELEMRVEIFFSNLSSLCFIFSVQPVYVKCSMYLLFISRGLSIWAQSAHWDGAQLSSIEANRSNTCNLDFISRIHKQDTTKLDNNIHLKAVPLQFNNSLMPHGFEKCSIFWFPPRSQATAPRQWWYVGWKWTRLKECISLNEKDRDRLSGDYTTQ